MVGKSFVVLSVLRELKEIFEKNGRKSVGILVGKIEGFFRRAAFPFLSQRTSGYSYFLARKRKTYSVIRFDWWKLLPSLLILVPLRCSLRGNAPLHLRSASIIAADISTGFF